MGGFIMVRLTTWTLSLVGDWTKIPSSYTTCKSSSVEGFSGSRIVRRISGKKSHWCDSLEYNMWYFNQTYRRSFPSNRLHFGTLRILTNLPGLVEWPLIEYSTFGLMNRCCSGANSIYWFRRRLYQQKRHSISTGETIACFKSRQQ